MIEEEKMATLNDLVDTSSAAEIIWMSGYLAGLAIRNPASLKLNGTDNGKKEPEKGNPVHQQTITILYGTETGNAKKAATLAAGTLRKQGLRTKLVAAEQYRLPDLEKETNLLIVISTQGEGEPPVPAKPFYDHLHQLKTSLTHLSYSVLALGSKSYPLYCQAGIDIDERLKALGAINIVPIQTCDDDYEPEASKWMENLQLFWKNKSSENTNPAPKPAALGEAETAPGKKIFTGVISTNITLNDRGSSRHTNHIEITTEEPFHYEAGDAIGVVPENSLLLVEKIIALTGLPAQQKIQWKNESIELQTLLASKVNLLHLSQRKVKAYSELIGQEIPEIRMDFYDLLRIYPAREKMVEALQLLDGLAPRIYTLSSSPNAHGDQEIHLTVLKTKYEKDHEQAYGLCSAFLCQLPIGTAIKFFLHRQKNFRLPDAEKPAIMIGPGTGIAPFRSFLAERESAGHPGKNWLFFGEENFLTDFYYQTEIQTWKELGVLHQLDVRFDKGTTALGPIDTQVRHQGAQLWDWIQSGAHIYVSGDKEPMSILVEESLVHVIEKEGNKNNGDARLFLKQLAKEGRYAKDVY